MPLLQLDDISHTQKKRLSHIDFMLNYLGSISRSDIINRFGIKPAAATRDIALYKKVGPNNIHYDGTTKTYTRQETFVSLFDKTPTQILTALTQGFGESFVGLHKPYIPCETQTQLNKPSLQVLSVLSRAIHQNKVVKITYHSLGSGISSREVIPFAMVDNGLRWHVRAFDRRRSRFLDFVVTRISEPKIIESTIEDQETREFDIQWNRIVELEIIANPRLDHPETIEFDYGMVDGVLKVNVRAAVAGYVLRLWNIDCSENYKLTGKEIHLCLRNSAALYGVDGVESLMLAPGHKS